MNALQCSFLAYIDPGSGSMLLQVIMATLIGGIFFVRRTIKQAFFWVKNKIFRGKQRE